MIAPKGVLYSLNDKTKQGINLIKIHILFVQFLDRNPLFNKVHGELVDLVVGKIANREAAEEITFFKSVGAAYYDLVVSKDLYKEALIIY
ncbi:hypothetical protein [Virgibacillus sp. CBA3643]|uniref:hypothetical protein n=1 Tax=Virgibacillus sp. CBA3643 TaxID=2942278 RepID=UPI0035A3D03A